MAYDPLRAQEALAYSIVNNLTALPIDAVPAKDDERRYVLYFSDTRTELVSWFNGGPGPVFSDFVSGAAEYRRLHGGGRGEMIARAVGLRKGVGAVAVLDATAGLGQDAFVLACLGCRLQLLERNPVVYAILQDGIRRLRGCGLPDIAGNVSLRQGSLLTMTQWPYGNGIDVIYLDPMFPEKKKKSLVKKEMQVFHDLVGDDADCDDLLRCALQAPVKRVVVKRPRLAPVLNGLKPEAVLSGKRCRYDIYARQRIA